MVKQVRTTPNVRQSLDLLKFELVHRKKILLSPNYDKLQNVLFEYALKSST